MFTTSRGETEMEKEKEKEKEMENEETLPSPGFKSYRAKKADCS
jgi:hypothetical protein